MKKALVVGAAFLAVWLFLPTQVHFFYKCPLTVYGYPVSYSFLLALLVGYYGLRLKAQ